MWAEKTPAGKIKFVERYKDPMISYWRRKRYLKRASGAPEGIHAMGYKNDDIDDI